MNNRKKTTIKTILKTYIKIMAHILGLVAVIISALGSCHLINYILHWWAK